MNDATSTLRFTLNGRSVDVDGVSPNLTLLNWLRNEHRETGTKEGCAEGDCGACTVVVVDPDAPGGPAPRAVNSCLVLLPMVHGREVFTVEGLAEGDAPHPVQAAMVEQLGSQCGYCTPGVVMSMVEAAHRADLDEPWKLDDQMCGNLCRCTGYRPIRDAAQAVAGTRPDDPIARACRAAGPVDRSIQYGAQGQRFAIPTSLDALWDALDADPTAELVSGCTDLGLRITKAFERIDGLVSLEAIPALRRLEVEADGTVHIGAGARLSDLEAFAQAALPPVERMIRFFGARQIKHRATVGGNLCTASPIGDLAPILLALDATAVLQSRAGARTVPLSDFFVGYRQTALKGGEILAAVRVPPVEADARCVAYKVSKRQELDISGVSAGLYVSLDEGGAVRTARFAYGGMAATPARAAGAEAAVIGQPWTEATVRRAQDALSSDFTPLDDHRGSAWYRATVARNLLMGFYVETGARGALPRLPYRPTGTVVPSEVTP